MLKACDGHLRFPFGYTQCGHIAGRSAPKFSGRLLEIEQRYFLFLDVIVQFLNVAQERSETACCQIFKKRIQRPLGRTQQVDPLFPFLNSKEPLDKDTALLRRKLQALSEFVLVGVKDVLKQLYVNAEERI